MEILAYAHLMNAGKFAGSLTVVDVRDSPVSVLYSVRRWITPLDAVIFPAMKLPSAILAMDSLDCSIMSRAFWTTMVMKDPNCSGPWNAASSWSLKIVKLLEKVWKP